MLTVSDLSKTFNIQTLFEKVNFSVNPGERIGLIGPNGSGKTTLLRILAGKESPASGQVHRSNGLRIGYLPQMFELREDCTIQEVVDEAIGDVQALESEVADMARELSKDPDNKQLADRYDDLLEKIRKEDRSEANGSLARLGLGEVDPASQVSILSGGQKTRLALALVLLSDPQILLLDEPTNHLDIEMLEWLEEWLAHTSCGALIVSHDRVFLDHTVTCILELDVRQHTLRAYEGNYSDYQERRRSEFEKHRAAYSDQQVEIRHMKEDVARTKTQAAYTERQASSVRIGGREIKNSKDYYQGIAKKIAKKAKSREKKLERYLDSEERVAKPKEDRSLYFEFSQTPHLGKTVIQLENLSIGYVEEKPLLGNIDLQVSADQRIVITGPNGSGKTTLLRTIRGELQPLKGKVILGSSVRMGLMSQDLSALDPEKTAVESVLPAFQNQTEARHFLAAYLLMDDEVLKPVRFLSQGQRARLEMAWLITTGCNVLLLDEPINHLDIPSRSQFEQALDQFVGTVLAVVHDRYFIEHFAREIWEVRDKVIFIKY